MSFTALCARIKTLDTFSHVVLLQGYFAAAEGFTSQPEVVDGASLLLEENFGETGRHAHVSPGVAELPGGVPVDIESIVEVP